MKIESYQKKGKTYYRFKIRLGDKVTSRSGFKSSTAAIAAYSDLKSNFEADTCGNITYEEVYKEWLPIYAARVKVTTLKNTTVKFENHILPIFAKKRIKDITVKECQDFAYSKKDMVKGKVYFNYAKRVMEYAKKIYDLDKNPFDNVMLPQFKKGEKQVNYLKAKEVELLLDYFKEDQYWLTFFRLMIYTGIRRGEALALTWSDIDFNNSTLTINKTLSTGKDYKTILSTPKTEESNRIIILDKVTLSELKKLKRKSNSTLMFPAIKGGWRRLSDPARFFKKALKSLNFPDMRIHDLRHTHASLLFASGADMKFVQARLGHSDIQTTMNIYTHVTEGAEKQNLNDFISYMESNK